MSEVGGSMEPVVRAGRTPSSRASHLVGRTDQRARLDAVLDEVIADGSRFVLLGGDAGAGKTTVIDAFTADLFSTLADRKAQLVRGQCVPLGGDGLPYAPIVGTLRDLVAQHGREQVLEWAGAVRTGARRPVARPDRRTARRATPSGCSCSRPSPSSGSGRASTRPWSWCWRTSTGPTSRPGTCCASGPGR